MSSQTETQDERGAGETLATILIGAAAGAAGVWVLDRIDWFMWNREGADTQDRTIAARPGGEPPAQALVTRVESLTGRDMSPDAHEAVSQAVHYTIGIAPAIGYALVRHQLPGAGLARGAAFGAGMFVSQDEVLNTVTGLGGRPSDYPWTAHARGIVAHTLYGIAVEYTLDLFESLGRSYGTRMASPDRSNRSAARMRAG